MAKEKDDIDSDIEKLSKAFATCVIITENKEAGEAEFSIYSWIADSGATTHICVHQSTFSDYTPIPKKEVQGLGNKPVSAYGKGTVMLSS